MENYLLDDFANNVVITAAFTGPRPHKFHFKDNENNPDCVRLKTTLKEHIMMLYHEHEVKRFLSGASTGVDMWAAELVLDLMEKYPEMKLFCIIPFKGQADKWSKEYQDRYYQILNLCTGIIYIRQEYHSDCFRERNQFLVRYARHLVAVDDLRKPAPRSGTRMTVNMGIRNRNQLWQILPNEPGEGFKN